MSIMQRAKAGGQIPELAPIAKAENLPSDVLLAGVATGQVVIVPGRGQTPPVAFGDSVRSKVLCNLGTSVRSPEIASEVEKARVAAARGAALICDQSVGPNVAANRLRLLADVPLPLAAVPLYQNAEDARRRKANPLAFSSEEMLQVFEEQLHQGITAPGIHVMTRELRRAVKLSKRVMPLVSRGGSLLAYWIDQTGMENAYITHFDELLQCCLRYEVPLTLICSCRAGCVEDGFDSLQKLELEIVGDLIRQAHARGVAVMVDGLGHMRLDQIPEAVGYYKQLCRGVPLGVMGPATTDRGLGHEHVVNAIGTAVAVQHGANYCNACARTEHLGLPEPADIPDTIGAALIATHVGDLARGKFRSADLEMARARKRNAWGVQLELALDRLGAKQTFDRVGAHNQPGEGCSICGDLCPFTVAHFASETP